MASFPSLFLQQEKGYDHNPSNAQSAAQRATLTAQASFPPPPSYEETMNPSRFSLQTDSPDIDALLQFYGSDLANVVLPPSEPAASERKMRQICQIAEYVCKFCSPNIHFRTSRQFHRHAKAHTAKQEQMPCWSEGCSTICAKSYSLVRHWRLTHSPSKATYQCAGCDYSAGIIGRIRAHYLSIHAGIPQRSIQDFEVETTAIPFEEGGLTRYRCTFSVRNTPSA